MWELATMSFAVAGIAAMALTEFLRHGKPRIVLWGTVATAICSVGTVISGVGWLITR
jgi:hypothetical protein